MRVPAKNTPKKPPGGPEVVLCLTWKRFFFVSGFKIVIFWNDSLPLWDTILHLIAKYIPNWRNMTQNEIQMFLMWCGMCVFSLCGGIQFQACSVFSLFRLFEYFYYHTHTHTQSHPLTQFASGGWGTQSYLRAATLNLNNNNLAKGFRQWVATIIWETIIHLWSN